MTISNAADVGNSTTTFLTSAQSTASAAIDTLNTVAAGWTNVTLGTDLAAATLNSYQDFPDSDATIKTALAAFNTTLAGITPPTLVSSPSLSSYTAPVWAETAWTNLKGLLTAFTSSITDSDDVGTVITKLTSDTTQMQVAMLAANRAQNQQALRDAFSAANAATGAMGFTFPASMTTVLQLAAQKTYQDDLSQTARDLIAKLLDWAKNNYQFSVQQGIAAHNADTEFNIRYATVMLESFSEQVKAALDDYRTVVAGEAAKMDEAIKSYSLRMEATKLHNVNSAEQDKANIENLRILVQQRASDASLLIENAAVTAKQRLDAAVATVRAATEMISSVSQISVGVLSTTSTA